MQKIIDGLLYDTDKAELLYYEEKTDRWLYKGENGHYFMYFLNGVISPKSEEFVKDYLGQRDIDKYIELFGEVDDA